MAAILVVAGFVASQDEKARQQCETKCVDFDTSQVSPPNHVENCQKCEADAEWHFPGWYRTFRWPDGVTTWALVLTLLTLAEQSRQTSISAKAAARGIEIQERAQRAWLVIHSAMKDYEPSVADKQLRFWWAIENRGHMTAQILATQCRYELVEDDPTLNLPPIPDYPLPILLNGLLIAPNDSLEFYTFLQRQDKSVVIPPLPVETLERVKEGFLWLRVYGHVRYRDGLGSERESRFIEYYLVDRTGKRRGYGFQQLLGVPSEYTKCT
ncbi:MAG: hypothetical protein WCF30_10515 [Terracidiphilus sp.]